MKPAFVLRFARLACIGSLVSLTTVAAHAQGTPNQPPPGAPTFPTPAPAASTPAPPPASASPLPAPAPRRYHEGRNDDDEPADEGRLRIGFNFNGGVGSGGSLSGPDIGATFRAGYQINHLLAVYGQLSVFGWFGTTDQTLNGQSLDIGAIGGYQFTPMFSVTPFDMLEIAAGPSADRMSGGSSSTSVTGSGSGASVNQSVSAYSGFYFGLHGRVALHIGGKPSTTTGRRVSFTIGGDIHPVFAEGSTITFYTIGLGADWY